MDNPGSGHFASDLFNIYNKRCARLFGSTGAVDMADLAGHSCPDRQYHGINHLDSYWILSRGWLDER